MVVSWNMPIFFLNKLVNVPQNLKYSSSKKLGFCKITLPAAKPNQPNKNPQSTKPNNWWTIIMIAVLVIMLVLLVLMFLAFSEACTLIEQDKGWGGGGSKKRKERSNVGGHLFQTRSSLSFPSSAFVSSPQMLPHISSTVTKSCSWLQELLRNSNTSRFYFHLQVRKGKVFVGYFWGRCSPLPVGFVLVWFFDSRKGQGAGTNLAHTNIQLNWNWIWIISY